MSKHTPEPWSVDRDGPNGKWRINSKDFAVATCDGPFRNQEADARLIVSAPVLLNQLTIARDRIIDLIAQDDPQAYKEAKKALPAIEAAILKAKGE